MIDPQARIELLREQGAEPDVAAILLDVVLGHGAHADPAGRARAGVRGDHRRRRTAGRRLRARHRRRTRRASAAAARRSSDAGCIVTETAARASLAAAALAHPRPELARREL